jgi:uncharacterized protein (UPF0332 family)
MFDAARAALIATQKPPESEAIKTHSGLISAFSLHLVKTGHVSVELGKSFKLARSPTSGWSPTTPTKK